MVTISITSTRLAITKHNLAAGLSFEHLNVFRVAVTQGSFRRAAAQLSLSQSAVSQRIKYLEAITGTRLFDRQRGSTVRVTEAGVRLLALADRVLGELDTFHSDLAVLHQPSTGDLVVCAGPNLIRYRLLSTAMRFRELITGVQLRLIEGSSPSTIAEMVLSGGAELGVYTGPVPDRLFRSFPLMRDRLNLIVRRGHPILLLGEAERARAVADYPFAVQPSGTDSRQSFDRWCRRFDIRVSILVEADVDTIKQAVVSSSAIGIAPDFALSEDVRHGSLDRLIMGGFPKERRISIIADARRPLSAAASALARLVQEDFRRAEIALETATRKDC
jgi:DNA-binding transcriptional LysR family regulator